MHECLRQVAPQLPLVHVVLLGVQRGGPAGAAVPLEPVRRRHRLAARVRRQRHPAPAQQERSLRQVQRPVVMPEPVHVPVDAELGPHRLDGREGTRVGQRQRAPDQRQQQGGVQPRVARRPLQPPGRVHAVAEARGDRVGQRRPARRRPVPVPAWRARSRPPSRSRAARPRRRAGSAPSAGRRVPRCPRPVPASASRWRRRRSPPPASRPRPSMSRPAAAASRESASPSASSWNWPRTQFPLLASPPGNPRSRSGRSPGMADPLTVYAGIRSGPSARSRSVTNRDRPGQQRVRPVGGDGEPRVALVADPRVPVVVVPPALQPLGQRRGGRRHHRAARRGQPAQHGVRVPRVGHGDQVIAVRHDLRPGLLRRRPQRVGIGGLLGKVKIS